MLDKKGNSLTSFELLDLIKMSIDGIVFISGDTNSLLKYFDDLVKSLESTEEYKRKDKIYNFYLKEIKNCLPINKKELSSRLDDCYTEILILYQEYFYKHGYCDGFRSRNILERII